MRQPRHPMVLRRIAWAVLLLITAGNFPRSFAQPPIELMPYKIRVLAIIQNSPLISPEMAGEIRYVLSERALSVVGAPWDLTLEEAPADLQLPLQSIPPIVSPEQMPAPWKEPSYQDKIMVLVVTASPTGWTTVAREFDSRTGLWGTPAIQECYQIADVATAAFEVLLEAFAPVAEIEEVIQAENQSKQVQVRVKGSALACRDPSVQFLKPGDAMRVIVRFEDRDGRTRRIDEVAWTLLHVQQLNGSHATCSLHSALRQPLTGRRRGRVRNLAIQTDPGRSPTVLRLVSRVDGKTALPGFEVYSHPPDNPRTELLGVSDYSGEIVVDAAPESMRVLLVKNGGEFLGRLPVIAGIVPSIDAKLPDDDARLETEGFVLGMQEEFIDLIARRKVLLVQARKAMESNDIKKARELVDTARAQGTANDFFLRIKDRRTTSASRDPRIQKKVQKLLDDTQMVIAEKFDARELEQLDTELRRLENPATAAN